MSDQEMSDKPTTFERLEALGLLDVEVLDPEESCSGNTEIMVGPNQEDVWKGILDRLALNHITKEQADQAKEAVMAELDGHFWERDEMELSKALQSLIDRLFPEEAPTDVDTTGGAHA